jgi:hypothetical protein
LARAGTRGCACLHTLINLYRQPNMERFEMAGTKEKMGSGRAAKRRRGASSSRYAVVQGERASESPKKKNLRLHQSKIDEAKAILGTATETETIEAALDLVVFRKELVEGVRAMRGAQLVDLFHDGD